MRRKRVDPGRWDALRALLLRPFGGSSSSTRSGAFRRHRLHLIRSSPLFDVAWYLRHNPDVAAARLDPARHYLENGWREGRDPGPNFSSKAYLEANADVAVAGLNPLVHFIEYGFAEGRGSSGHRPAGASPLPTSEPFGEAAPVVRFEAPIQDPIRWRRYADLDLGRGDCFLFDGCPVGYVQDSKEARVAAEFGGLVALSGGPASPGREAQAASDAASLIDAWYLKSATLRTRWSGEASPFAVRAFQYEPSTRVISMIGEGLVQSPLDPVNVGLINPYFPVLFVIADPDGAISTTCLLAFPSLCRGGLHYSELLAHEDNPAKDRGDPLDPVGLGRSLADGIAAIRSGAVSPAIRNLTVDLAGADGTGPLFQPDFQSWLTYVMGVGACARNAEAEDDAQQYLARTVTVTAATGRSGGGTLILAADMIPTIHLLLRPAAEAGSGNQPRSMLVAGTDRTQPAVLLRVPAAISPALTRGVRGHAPQWPRFEPAQATGIADEAMPVAIRKASSRPPADVELLFPSMGDPEQADREAISWLMGAGEWRPDELAQALESLSLQAGCDEDRIVIVGADKAALEVCERVFPRRVRPADDLVDAVAAIDTPFTAYTGGGIILHDRRCSLELAQLAELPGTASAACVLLSSRKRGIGWEVAIVDPGTLPVEPGRDADPPHCDWPLQTLWRATYPVALPPEQFWLARSPHVGEWIKGAGLPDDQAHICTSAMTASLLDRPAGLDPLVRPPAAHRSKSLQLVALFG